MKKDCFDSIETGNFTGSFSWAKWFSEDGPTLKLISGPKTFPPQQINLSAIETTISKENTIRFKPQMRISAITSSTGTLAHRRRETFGGSLSNELQNTDKKTKKLRLKFRNTTENEKDYGTNKYMMNYRHNLRL